jgi:hypothetical protein
MLGKIVSKLKQSISIDEIVFLLGLVLSWTALLTVTKYGEPSLWVSLIIITSAAIFYSLTFYKSEQYFVKFLFFLFTISMIILYFAFAYIGLGLIGPLSEERITPSASEALYFSVVTWTTLGYGDYRPTEAARVWVIVEALTGYLFMALLVAKILFLAQLNSLKTKDNANTKAQKKQ